jgi:hypothetical protein
MAPMDLQNQERPDLQRLKQEITRLHDEQSKALAKAIYVGMSVEETKQYDERHKRINHLVQELAALERPQ